MCLTLFTPCFDSPSLCSFGFTSEVFWRPARHSHFLFKILYERLHLFSTTNSAEKLQLLPGLPLSLVNHPWRFGHLFFCFSSFSWTVLTLVSLFSSSNLRGLHLSGSFSDWVLLAPYPASPLHEAFRLHPRLALHCSFNPSCSGSVAIKEPHFTGACYRSVSHRTHTSLCSAVKAFKTVCAL